MKHSARSLTRTLATAAIAIGLTAAAAPANAAPVTGSDLPELPTIPPSSSDISDLFGSSGFGDGEELSQVNYVDIDSYAGTWHQLATIPQIFQVQCARDTTAEYKVIEPGKISVVNTCTDWFGNSSSITGAAKVTNPETNASLRVAFNGIPGQDINGETNYRITYLSEDGNIAIVGSPDKKSGWVLSRTPSVSPQVWDEIESTLDDRGWWPCLFVATPVAGGVETPTPVCAL
ncbi:lipocalin family protein [Corynebacterium sp. TAE3-ERU12]|uniref:lipocalin family protein n=1 Tax=Corynebacterium sp. TAE3-ERU12 TaxID=2849491 RepID=UPI001C44D872|nr:lipocalin family protein [Corynebacterium sp. TAE3-ERU12]MBV7294372.1 lipocalin family protein [Corynebacterium sp. TAE3-ERU12]